MAYIVVVIILLALAKVLFMWQSVTEFYNDATNPSGRLRHDLSDPSDPLVAIIHMRKYDTKRV